MFQRLLIAAILVGAAAAPACRNARPLPGYVEDLSSLRQEHKRIYDSILIDQDTIQGFQQAALKARDGDYRDAAALLKLISLHAALPTVYNDLGVLYAQLNDGPAAVNEFLLALARDPGNQAFQINLERARKAASLPGPPEMSEAEPNDSPRLANEIGLGVPMRGEIAEGAGDIDCYRLVAPAGPRDLMEVEALARSQTLAPHLRFSREDGEPLDWGGSAPPGATLKQRISAQPNQVFYLQLSGAGDSSGPYNLTVRPLKAFDQYEPNDTIFTARPLHPGQSIEANIMDASDTDYFSFAAPRTGTIAIDIHSSSATLIPALTVFQPDKSNGGFGPDIRTPGPLHHTMEVQAGQVYFLQVWSQAETAGAYSLIVE